VFGLQRVPTAIERLEGFLIQVVDRFNEAPLIPPVFRIGHQ
jgi:hypothetical protein